MRVKRSAKILKRLSCAPLKRRLAEGKIVNRIVSVKQIAKLKESMLVKKMEQLR